MKQQSKQLLSDLSAFFSDLSAGPSPPNPAGELARNIKEEANIRDELASDSDEFAIEIARESAWESGVQAVTAVT